LKLGVLSWSDCVLVELGLEVDCSSLLNGNLIWPDKFLGNLLCLIFFGFIYNWFLQSNAFATYWALELKLILNESGFYFYSDYCGESKCELIFYGTKSAVAIVFWSLLYLECKLLLKAASELGLVDLIFSIWRFYFFNSETLTFLLFHYLWSAPWLSLGV